LLGSVYMVLWGICRVCVVFMVAGVFGEEERRRHRGRCIDCGEVLELYMLDLKKGRRILQCTSGSWRRRRKSQTYGDNKCSFLRCKR